MHAPTLDLSAPPNSRVRAAALALVAMLLPLAGCTPFTEYVHNGFKVGPNFGRPPAPVAKNWIDASDKRVRSESDDLSKWWAVFQDPVLDSLICDAYRQNLTLRQAGFKVLMARAQRGIAIGELFPQTQTATGDWTRNATSIEDANRQFGVTNFRRFFPQWDLGFNLSWELDFWGRFRRTIEQAGANLDVSVENYDGALVTLLGDVATDYVQIRTLEKQIEFTRANAELQLKTLIIAKARFKGGTATELDVDQAQSNLSQTESQVPQLEITLRQTNNALCILLGIPPEDLNARLGKKAIPVVSPDVAVGIPADLLRRRPDVLSAERQAAADAAAIGIAEADFYPHLSLSGTFGYSAAHFNRLFRPTAFEGSFGPQFSWEILNYGRILNNVRAEQALFQSDVAAYQNTVLSAAQDVENSLATFLKSQEQVKFLAESVDAAEKAVVVALAQYQGGTVNFNTVALVEQNLVTQQNLLAQAQGNIALGLISVYRALGGGWQIRINGCEATTTTAATTTTTAPGVPEPSVPPAAAPGVSGPSAPPAAAPGVPGPSAPPAAAPGVPGPSAPPAAFAPAFVSPVVNLGKPPAASPVIESLLPVSDAVAEQPHAQIGAPLGQ
jgi:NodT family efflux transporter outer membrane factor (OMF) lipoprotein